MHQTYDQGRRLGLNCNAFSADPGPSWPVTARKIPNLAHDVIPAYGPPFFDHSLTIPQQFLKTSFLDSLIPH